MTPSASITNTIGLIGLEERNYWFQLKNIIGFVVTGLTNLGQTAKATALQVQIQAIGKEDFVYPDQLKPMFLNIQQAMTTIGGAPAVASATALQNYIQGTPNTNSEVWFDQIKPLFQTIVTAFAAGGQ